MNFLRYLQKNKKYCKWLLKTRNYTAISTTIRL